MMFITECQPTEFGFAVSVWEERPDETTRLAGYCIIGPDLKHDPASAFSRGRLRTLVFPNWEENMLPRWKFDFLSVARICFLQRICINMFWYPI
jgi:hypothetical protein